MEKGLDGLLRLAHVAVNDSCSCFDVKSVGFKSLCKMKKKDRYTQLEQVRRIFFLGEKLWRKLPALLPNQVHLSTREVLAVSLWVLSYLSVNWKVFLWLPIFRFSREILWCLLNNTCTTITKCSITRCYQRTTKPLSPEKNHAPSSVDQISVRYLSPTKRKATHF